jgi:heterodisulfide reductase subunit A
MSDEEVVEHVGSVVVATGLEAYDPTELDEYGYTRHENVLSSPELERLISAGGPTGGELIRPTDRRIPKSIGFVQCVGSRSVRKGAPYCSNICCMNTVKSTLVLKEHYPNIEIKVFYIDIRAFGKGFEDLYRKSRTLGVQYIRGLPGNVVETAEGGLRVAIDNGASGKISFHDLDMLVLAVGIKPSETTKKLQEMFGLQLSPDGFFLEAHPKLQPVDAATKGIFFAGCAEGPKDIKDSVTQGSAAAVRVLRLLHRGEMLTDPITAEVIQEKCKICGICAEVCPYGAISLDVKRKIAASVNSAACSGCGTCAAECPFDSIVMNHFTDGQIMGQIESVFSQDPATKILAFACNWCSYAGADFAGVSRLQYPPTLRLIRTMCSGRVDESFIWEGFAKGAPVILVSGCHIGDCHYINANQWTVKRIDKIRKKMEKLAIRPERLQLEWISAAEGLRFSQLMGEMEKLRLQVTPQEIAETMRLLAEKKQQR